ncbi:hypothetical protein [Tenacibaculum sp. M341]|uniref:hypothetical protein n=1 Tax=Tenacibaculum sp. M341 TaxID=2530339 RepID=UPI00104B45F1|nr:hypothetical protein [Tenacibaculum sp. M341]TCI93783.1 hypothetical protein EYW44_05040 [Tenacibaculum sp. M341]
MKKNILKQIKANILTKEEKKTIVGGYDGSYVDSWPCSFIICGGPGNTAGRAYKPGCPSTNNGWRLYVYKPNPSLFCWE